MHRPSGRTNAVAILSLLAAAVLLAWPQPAAAQSDWDLGVRGGVYTGADAGFVGVEALGRIGRTSWYFNPNVEAAFPDNEDLYTFNADFHYDIPTGSNVAVWLGGGPALILHDPNNPRRDNETDFGGNLIAGIGLQRGAVRPYLQGKLIFADDTEAVLAVGFRFF